ncbi:MAG: ATP-binding cassette domain-containing protein [Bacteroidales bacterium]|nr:ATP-binding cassette domain-containing protein [Bacteroidales bacterium]
MISIKNLSFSYGNNAVLENISMTLQSGRIYGLLGENGVGKTTLLTLLSGLKKTNGGSIDIDGATPFERKPSFLDKIYYLPDDVEAPAITAEKYARQYGSFWSNFDFKKFTALMSLFEMNINRKMNSMSTGELKKTHISFALSLGVKYLFLDEPTNGLDIPSKASFRKAVMSFTAEDSTLVISTHQVKDLENIIDPIIILDNNSVLLNASLEEISGKLYFDYSLTESPSENCLYSETLPSGTIRVLLNPTGEESKVNIEALFNACHANKQLVKSLFE